MFGSAATATAYNVDLAYSGLVRAADSKPTDVGSRTEGSISSGPKSMQQESWMQTLC